MRRGGAGGFTLLEVMVALAILGAALTLIGQGVARNVRLARHARMSQIATLLARQKMADVEYDLYHSGFSDFPEDDGETFAEQGHPEFRWEMHAEKVELPSNLSEAATAASEKLEEATKQLGESSGLDTKALAQATDSSMLSTLLSSFGGIVDQLRLAMEDSLRRVTVRILWNEQAREESLDVTAYYIDTTRMTLGTGGGVALPGGAGGASGLGGLGSSPGSSGGAGSSRGTK